MTVPAAEAWSPYLSMSRKVTLPGGKQLQVFEKGTGKPLLYLHGFGLQPGWNAMLDELAKSRRVIAPLTAGFGESTGLDDIDEMVDVVVYLNGVLDTLDLASTDVVAFDYGGMLAAEFAAASPGRVEKLVLIAPFGLWIEGNEPVDLFAVATGDLPRVLFADPESPAAKAWVAMPDAPDALLEVTIQRVRAMAASTKFLWPIPERGLKKRLHAVKAPTLLLWGAKDALIPGSYADAFRAKIPDARIQVVDAGHMVPLEAPSAAASVIGTFLR